MNNTYIRIQRFAQSAYGICQKREFLTTSIA